MDMGRAARGPRGRHRNADDPEWPCCGTSPMTPVLTSPWPRSPEDEREVAQVIAAAVQRERGGEPASVQHEERLGADVAQVVARAVTTPHASGLPLAVASELAGNPGFRANAQRNATILASHLYPLSLLIYGADLENITCLAHDHWLVSTVGRKLSLIGDSPF